MIVIDLFTSSKSRSVFTNVCDRDQILSGSDHELKCPVFAIFAVCYYVCKLIYSINVIFLSIFLVERFLNALTANRCTKIALIWSLLIVIVFTNSNSRSWSWSTCSQTQKVDHDRDRIVHKLQKSIMIVIDLFTNKKSRSLITITDRFLKFREHITLHLLKRTLRFWRWTANFIEHIGGRHLETFQTNLTDHSYYHTWVKNTRKWYVCNFQIR